MIGVEDYAYYCDYCGDVNVIISSYKNSKCLCCNKGNIHETPHEYNITADLLEHNLSEYKDNIRKFKNEHIKNDQSDYYLKQKEKHAQYYIQSQSQNIPKCPTCQSTNIKKISGTKRFLSTGFFGLASSDLGKTFICNNCSYKW